MLLVCVSDHFGLRLAPPGSLLGAFWSLWVALGRHWGTLGAPLGPSGLSFRRSGANFLPKQPPGASKIASWMVFSRFLLDSYQFLTIWGSILTKNLHKPSGNLRKSGPTNSNPKRQKPMQVRRSPRSDLNKKLGP